VQGCTLDPGGTTGLDGNRGPIRASMHLESHYGFATPAEETAFDQTPGIVVQRSILGPMEVDEGYRVHLADTILDAGGGVGNALPALAFRAASGDPELEWGPPLSIAGLTCFGRVRAGSATGRGGIFVHALRVQDNQVGCLKQCWFSGNGDWLPANHACLAAAQARLYFVAEDFGAPAYAQIAQGSDAPVFDHGPGDDEFGAYGFARNTHRWKNLSIRFREYMPVGVRAVTVVVA